MTSGLASEWLEIAIPVAGDADAEAIAALLPEEVPAAGRGTELRPGEVVFWVQPELAEAVLMETREAARRLAGAGLAIEPAQITSRAAAPEGEWRDAYKRHFRIARLTRQLVVVPSWERAGFEPEPEDRVLHLDPGQAFGTGAHASTCLVLELMQEARDQGLEVKRFLDVGTGSGILSIAAALFWPEATGVAVDHDPVAVRAARENLEENRVSARIECDTRAPAELPGTYDLVLANIQRDVLLAMAGALAARVGAGGRLILSGLLTEQVEEVARHYEGQALRAPTTRRSEADPEWSAAVLLGPAP